jgi:hypothetical protein
MLTTLIRLLEIQISAQNAQKDKISSRDIGIQKHNELETKQMMCIDDPPWPCWRSRINNRVGKPAARRHGEIIQPTQSRSPIAYPYPPIELWPKCRIFYKLTSPELMNTKKTYFNGYFYSDYRS